MKLDRHEWADYFRDTNPGALDLGKLYLKWLPGNRKETLDKEYYAQKVISSIKLAPKPYLKLRFPSKHLPSLFLEEKVFFEKEYTKSDKFIKDVATSLREMHDYARANKNIIMNNIPENKLLTSGRYDPLVILKTFIQNPLRALEMSKNSLLNQVARNTLSEIEKKIINIEKGVQYSPDQCSLIHGDLNNTNLVKTKGGEIMIIDWADCRWDIVTCDLSQFIYLHFLTKREKKLFLDSYGAYWITEKMLEIHRLLLVGWDIIYLTTVDLVINPNTKDRLRLLKKKVWEEAKISL